MNYKETLFFIGSCLTVNYEAKQKILIENELKTKAINWDNIVKLSTSHFVFPALYINLKKANLLNYVPDDLIAYMEHITSLNRVRNTKIIEQALRVHHLFIKNNITPVFTKGTAFLLLGLYDDIGERMVGDIDFLVDPKDFEKAIEITKQDGYYCDKKYDIIITERHIHYPKIVKKDEIAAIEIHFRPTRNPHAKVFHYDFLKTDIQKLNNGCFTLSNNNHVLLTSFNKQISDRGKWIESFALRNSYDLFLLSKRTNAYMAIKKFGHYHQLLNNFLASSSELLGKPDSLAYLASKQTEKLLKRQIKNIENPKRQVIKTKFWNNYFEITLVLTGLLRATYSKKYRKYLISRVKSYF